MPPAVRALPLVSRRCGDAAGVVPAAMRSRGGESHAPATVGWADGDAEAEAESLEGPQSRVRWALRRVIYALDSVASSPLWQGAFLFVLAIAICCAGAAAIGAAANEMPHANEAHDTSYAVRAPCSPLLRRGCARDAPKGGRARSPKRRLLPKGSCGALF